MIDVLVESTILQFSVCFKECISFAFLHRETSFEKKNLKSLFKNSRNILETKFSITYLSVVFFMVMYSVLQSQKGHRVIL